jgi:hypothetical protein
MRFTCCLLLSLVGCTQASDGPVDLPEFNAACAEVSCTVAGTVSSPAELQAAIVQGAAWSPHGEYTAGCLPASGDLAVTGTVMVDGADIALPETCTAQCDPAVGFRLRGDVAGVTCLDPESFFDFSICRSISITDATIRVRTVVEDVHPAGVIALVEVLPACEQPCGEGEFRCDATNTCWGSERDYCAYCLGGDNEVCACWSDGDFDADGSECSMYVSGDSIVSGTCNAGVCEVE